MDMPKKKNAIGINFIDISIENTIFKYIEF